MGAGVSTEGAPLTRVKCKDNIGVLFDPEAEKAFAAAATGPDDELAVPWADVDAYVKSRILPAGGPSQAARVDGSGANLLLKECPSAGFCSPTKYAGTGKPGNDYKFAILRDGGAYFCHRCGGKTDGWR